VLPCRTILSGSLPLAILVCSLLIAQEPKAKLPVPTDDALAEALKLAKEVYGDEYRDAKTDAEKTTLARALIDKARESQEDPAGRFVLLRLARDIAAQAGDAETSLDAADELARAFQIDTLPMQVETLKKVSRVVSLPKHCSVVAERAAILLDSVLREDDFDQAATIGDLALAAARKSGKPEAIKEVANRNREIDDIRKTYMAIKDMRARLEEKPTDPEANLAVGRYACLLKGDWEKGIPMLALGSDEKLKALATKELEEPSDTQTQVSLGDGWWDLAETEEGIATKHLLQRATYWYKMASPQLTGLLRAKVDKRLGSVLSESQAGAMPVGATNRGRIDPQPHIVDLLSLATKDKKGKIARNGLVLEPTRPLTDFFAFPYEPMSLAGRTASGVFLIVS
jgi:hypothetical protein